LFHCCSIVVPLLFHCCSILVPFLFAVLPLLRKLVPGGDGSRLIERGVKHKWVKLVQTTTAKIGGSSSSRKKKSRSSSAATLATSLGVGEFDFDDDEEAGEEEENAGNLVKVHKNAGEICVSIVLVSECEVISDDSSDSSSISNIDEGEEDDEEQAEGSRGGRGSRMNSPRTGLGGLGGLGNGLGGPSRDTGSKNSPRRVGVHRGFGNEDFHYAASRLRTVRKELKLKPMELFATIDTNRSGNIDRQQFVDVMCRLDEDTTADEASLVFDHFDISNNGRMNYNEFLKMIVGGEGKQKSSSALALALALSWVLYSVFVLFFLDVHYTLGTLCSTLCGTLCGTLCNTLCDIVVSPH
jgi:hypothetical protein